MIKEKMNQTDRILLQEENLRKEMKKRFNIGKKHRTIHVGRLKNDDNTEKREGIGCDN